MCSSLNLFSHVNPVLKSQTTTEILFLGGKISPEVKEDSICPQNPYREDFASGFSTLPNKPLKLSAKQNIVSHQHIHLPSYRSLLGTTCFCDNQEENRKIIRKYFLGGHLSGSNPRHGNYKWLTGHSHRNCSWRLTVSKMFLYQ